MRRTLVASLLLLGACSNASDEPTTPQAPTPQQVDYADRAQPEDAVLASIYNRSCRTCHGVDGMGAPLTGHEVAWQERESVRGVEGLLASTRNGLNAMPARGLCEDCSDEDFLALISFMSEGAAQ